jgi:hypothetical protein
MCCKLLIEKSSVCVETESSSKRAALLFSIKMLSLFDVSEIKIYKPRFVTQLLLRVDGETAQSFILIQVVQAKASVPPSSRHSSSTWL